MDTWRLDNFLEKNKTHMLPSNTSAICHKMATLSFKAYLKTMMHVILEMTNTCEEVQKCVNFLGVFDAKIN